MEGIEEVIFRAKVQIKDSVPSVKELSPQEVEPLLHLPPELVAQQQAQTFKVKGVLVYLAMELKDLTQTMRMMIMMRMREV